ncbi:MAG: Sortase family protein [Microgenomates bacterium OLB22]|nr:MAG: Sortase family protein [Microgenomates bacterium OLB22]
MAARKNAHNKKPQEKQAPRATVRGAFGSWYANQTQDQKRMLLIMLVGVLLILCSVKLYITSLSQPTFIGTPHQYNAEQNNTPMLIRIAAIDVSLPIEKGYIEKGKWHVSATAATYLDASSTPGNAGPIVIYGHNKREILGLLPRVKNGDYVSILTADQKIHNYQIQSKTIVSPHQVSVLEAKDETLIIYTCAGWADTQRLVVKAKPVR